MSQGIDRDMRELIRALRENTDELRALRKLLIEMESVSEKVQELKREAFKNYMGEVQPVPGAEEPLVLGICSRCAVNDCGNVFSPKSNCSCCRINHKRYKEGSTNG